MRPGLPLRSMLYHLITLCTLGTANFDLPHSSGCFGYPAEILVANFLLLCVEGIDPAVAAGVHKDPVVSMGYVLWVLFPGAELHRALGALAVVVRSLPPRVRLLVWSLHLIFLVNARANTFWRPYLIMSIFLYLKRYPLKFSWIPKKIACALFETQEY